VYSFEGKIPEIGPGTYVAETAVVIGDVKIGTENIVMPGASIKGDYGTIRIGSRNSIQDCCILHARPDETLTVGSDVTVGHGSTLHNCTIEDLVTIGMRAVVSDYAIVRRGAIVGEGAVVRQHQEIPENAVAVGVPAKVIGEVKPGVLDELKHFKAKYVEMAHRYSKPGALVRIG